LNAAGARFSQPCISLAQKHAPFNRSNGQTKETMFAAAVKLLTRILVAIGAVALAAMMFLTAFDVVMRYVFNQPVKGALEMVEYLMAVLVSFSIAYCAEQKGHVTVDLIMAGFSKRVQAFFNFITNLMALVLTGLICWQSILYITDTHSSRLTSAVLLIPAYPFVAVVAVGFGVYALLLAIHSCEYAAEVLKS
jgi:TRAP-type transport system small permease protein